MLLETRSCYKSNTLIMNVAFVLPICHAALAFSKEVNTMNHAHMSVEVRWLGELAAAEDTLDSCKEYLHLL